MGFLRPHKQGRGNQQSNDLINQQINQNKVELEQRRASLYGQRLAIIKSQGMQAWGKDAAQIVSGLTPQGQRSVAKAGFGQAPTVNSLFPS